MAERRRRIYSIPNVLGSDPAPLLGESPLKPLLPLLAAWPRAVPPSAGADQAWAAGVFELRGRGDSFRSGKPTCPIVVPRIRLSAPDEPFLLAFQRALGGEGNVVGPDGQNRLLWEASSRSAERVARTLLPHTRGVRGRAILEAVLAAMKEA